MSLDEAFDSFRVTCVVEREDNCAFFLKAIIDGLNDAPSITLGVCLSRGRGIRKRCQRVEIRPNYVLGEVVWNVPNLVCHHQFSPHVMQQEIHNQETAFGGLAGKKIWGGGLSVAGGA